MLSDAAPPPGKKARVEPESDSEDGQVDDFDVGKTYHPLPEEVSCPTEEVPGPSYSPDSPSYSPTEAKVAAGPATKRVRELKTDDASDSADHLDVSALTPTLFCQDRTTASDIAGGLQQRLGTLKQGGTFDLVEWAKSVGSLTRGPDGNLYRGGE